MKNILLVAFFTIVHSSLVAQWEFTNGPFGSYINHLDHNDHFVFAATTAGIFKSADGGLTWEHRAFAPGTALEITLPESLSPGFYIFSMVCGDQTWSERIIIQ